MQLMNDQAQPAPAAPGARPSRPAERPDLYADLLSRIEEKTAVVGVIGLGYVGLPLARTFAANGYRVLGFDVDAEKVARLGEGKSYIGHIGDEVVREMRGQGFDATDRFERLDEADAVLV